ncbi:MAG: restriction endonuclease subunit S [Verrucomicrobia bacterium]|nr:restriction endonuclease subunit S [Verrucomicrobiota bacterium]
MVTSGSRGWAKYYSDEGLLFLRVGNLDHNSIRLDLSDVQRVKPPAGAEGTRTKVETGDILISITADVGMIALVPTDLDDAYINQHVSLARPLNGFCREYLAWYLAARDGGQKRFLQLQRGATKVGLGLDDIRAVPVPLPPLTEQQEIVAEVERRLSVIEKLEAEVTSNLKRADRLRQSILQQAFQGNLASNGVRRQQTVARLTP